MEVAEPRGGGGVASLMRFLEEDVEGGVLGRGEEELERFLYHLTLAISSEQDGANWAASYSVSNLRTSAWEYAAQQPD